MVPYTVREGIVPPEEVALWRRIWNIVDRLPDTACGPDDSGHARHVSCHMLARAIAHFFPDLRVADGYYEPNVEHSWLVTQTGNILDVYPVAGASGPVLYAADRFSPVARHYREQEVWQAPFGQQWFLRAVEDLKRAIEPAL